MPDIGKKRTERKDEVMFTGVTAEALTEYIEFVNQQEELKETSAYLDECGQVESLKDDEPLPTKPGKKRKERRFKRR